MDIKLLIGDKTALIGKKMAKNMLRLGICAYCCKNCIDDIIAAAECIKPQAVVFNIIFPDEKGIAAVERFRETYPDIIIITGVFSSDRSYHSAIADAGSDRSFIFPVSFPFICRQIMLFMSEKLTDTMHSPIERFLLGYGLSDSYKGFRWFVCAAEMCIEQPSLLSGGMMKIYSRIAEMANTDKNCVERAMRHFISRSCEDGSIERILHGRTVLKPSNNEFIAIVVDTYYHEKRLTSVNSGMFNT